MIFGIFVAALGLGMAASSAFAAPAADYDMLNTVRATLLEKSSLFAQVGEVGEELRFCGFDSKADRLTAFIQQKAEKLADDFIAKNSGPWDNNETRAAMRTVYLSYAMGLGDGAGNAMKDTLPAIQWMGNQKSSLCNIANERYVDFMAR